MVIETCPKCGHDLIDSVIAVMPPIRRKECLHCGWNWEGKPEKTIRVPFSGGIEMDFGTMILDTQTPCKYCGNNPKNGGSGICHCVSGLQTFY